MRSGWGLPVALSGIQVGLFINHAAWAFLCYVYAIQLSAVLFQILHLKKLLYCVQTGQVNKSSPQKPGSRNIFKKLICCLRAQDAQLPTSPTHDALLAPEDNGTIAKVL